MTAKTGLTGAPGGGVQHKGDILGVARGGSLNLAGALFNQGMRFLVTLLLARFLGKDDVGLYFQAYAFLALLGLLSLSGFKRALTRFVAVHRAQDDRASLHGTVRLGLGVPSAAAAVLGVVLYASADLLAAGAFHDVRLAMPLRVVAAALPATVFTDAALAATQGFRTMRPYAFIGLFFEPAGRITLTLLLLLAGYGLGGAMVALLITNVIAACLAAVALRRLVGRFSDGRVYRLGELFAFSSISWVANLASVGLVWVDTILLGLFGSASQVGVYQVATRLVLVVTVFMPPLENSFAPRIADLIERGRHQALEKLYGLVTSWILRLSLPAFLMLMVFSSELLSLFGPGFEEGAFVTMLLALGELFNVATGPCGQILLMSGRPALIMASNLAGLGLNVGLNLWLIPRYGIVGAGIAWAISLAVVNVSRAWLVWVTMRMLPLDRGLARALPALAAAAIVASVVQWLSDGYLALGLGAIGVVATYVGLVVGAGIEPEDRLILEMLKQRFRRNATASPT